MYVIVIVARRREIERRAGHVVDVAVDVIAIAVVLKGNLFGLRWRGGKLGRKRKGVSTKTIQVTETGRRREVTNIQLGAPCHHLLEGNADALDDGQQHRAANGAVARRLVAAADGQRAAREEARNDGVVGVLLPAHALDRAVKCREQATPHAKVAAQHGRTHLDGRQRADAALAVGGVAEALDAVPDGTADGLGS